MAETIVDRNKVQDNPEKVILEAVPKDKKEMVERALTVIRSEIYSGPIPSPESFEKYEKVLPGAADRILKMAERQQEHRMSLEKEAVGSQVRQGKRGQVFGFVIFFICIAVAIFFAVKLDMKTFASVFLTGTMVAVIGLFITGKSIMRNDLRSKSRDQEK